jgi:hypothetical protein
MPSGPILIGPRLPPQACMHVSARDPITNRAETSKPHPPDHYPGIHDRSPPQPGNHTHHKVPTRHAPSLPTTSAVVAMLAVSTSNTALLILWPKNLCRRFCVKKEIPQTRLTHVNLDDASRYVHNMTSHRPGGLTGFVRVWTRRMNCIIRAFSCFFRLIASRDVFPHPR